MTQPHRSPLGRLGQQRIEFVLAQIQAGAELPKIHRRRAHPQQPRQYGTRRIGTHRTQLIEAHSPRLVPPRRIGPKNHAATKNHALAIILNQEAITPAHLEWLVQDELHQASGRRQRNRLLVCCGTVGIIEKAQARPKTASAVMELHQPKLPRPERTLIQQLKAGVESQPRCDAPGIGQHIAALDIVPDQIAAEVEGTTLPHLPDSRVLALGMNAPHPDLESFDSGSAREQAQGLPYPDAAGERRSRDDQPDSLQHEGPIHRKTEVPAHRALGLLFGTCIQRIRQCRKTGPRMAGNRKHATRRQQPADAFAHCRNPRQWNTVDLRDHDQDLAHSQQPHDPYVLQGLWHHPFPGIDHQHAKIDATDTRNHRIDETPVPRHVDEADHLPPCRPAVGKTQLDGQATPTFLLQPVGIHTGQLPDQ